MKARDVIDILMAAIPKEDSWSHGESYGPYNVKPEAEIRKVLYCVTPTPEIQKYFLQHGYDLLVSHHPYQTNLPQTIFHTALDCCQGGLNDMWRDGLGITDAKHFDGNLGWAGQIEPTTLKDLAKKIKRFTERKILGQACSKIQTIRSVVVCSGLGGMVLNTALKSGADCYIIGEATWDAKHSGFKAVIETGHTNSEWIGVRLIRDLLEPFVQVDLAPSELDTFGYEVYQGRKAG